jgi:hypothetical protein
MFTNKNNVLIILFFVLSIRIYAGECPICKKNYPDKYLFCPVHGIKISDMKFEVIKKEPQNNELINNLKKVKEKESEYIFKIENRKRLLEKIKKNVFSYDVMIQLAKDYFDKDKILCLLVLENLQKKYPDDYEVLKLSADFYMSIEDYNKAAEFYNKIEKSINQQIKEIMYKNID